MQRFALALIILLLLQSSLEDPERIFEERQQLLLNKIAEMEEQAKVENLKKQELELKLGEEKEMRIEAEKKQIEAEKKQIEAEKKRIEAEEKRIEAEKKLRENGKNIAHIVNREEKLARSAEQLAVARKVFERLKDAHRQRERRKRKSSEKAGSTVVVQQGQILDALRKHETDANLACSTGSIAVDKNTDVATRHNKGRGRGAPGYRQRSRRFRKLAIKELVANMPSPVESRGNGVGGIRCGHRFLLNLLIAVATTACTVQKFVKLLSNALSSADSYEVTLAPLNGNKGRRLPTKPRSRKIEDVPPAGQKSAQDEISDRPIDCGSVSASTLIRSQYALHLALDKHTLKSIERTTHLSICSDISTTGIIHALNIVAVGLTVNNTGKDAMGADTYETIILRYALNSMTASDKMRKERGVGGDAPVAACVGEKIALSATRGGIAAAFLNHPSSSFMSDGAGENTGDAKGCKDDFCGHGSVLRDVFMTRTAFQGVVRGKCAAHLRRVFEYLGLDFDELVNISLHRQHPVRLPTDEPIWDIIGMRVSMPANHSPLRYIVLIEGGAPSAHHCLKHIMSLANGDVMIANKALTVMAIAVIRFFRNRHVWSRMNSIILQIFASNGSRALEVAGGESDSSIAWQAGQEDIWSRTRVLERMIQTCTVLMPCHGSYIRWLSIIRGLGLLACMLHVLLAATVIASGQGLDKNKVAMAKGILSGRGLDDQRLVRFEDRVGEKVFMASQPYFVLYAWINRFFHVLVWSLIDDATSRNKDCSLLYMGGVTGVIRTLLWILEKKMYVHWKCPNGSGRDFIMEHGKGVPVDNGIQNPKSLQQGWNIALRLAHRGVSKANPGRGLLTLKLFSKGERGLQQVRKMYGTWGNMVDAPSIQEMFHLLPEIIGKVSRMNGSDKNVIPPGNFRNSYQKVSSQDTEEERERAAWWFFREMSKKTRHALETRFTPILYSPLAFLAAAGDVDQHELTPRPPLTCPKNRTFYAATSTARANGAIFYLQSKELIRYYAIQGKDLSQYVQKPYSKALKPDALAEMRVFFQGSEMTIGSQFWPFLDSTGEKILHLRHPLNFFSKLSGLSDEANARIVSNQGVESNFSLTANFTAAGATRPSEHYYHAAQSRNPNLKGREKDLRESETFLASFADARDFMNNSENEKGERAIFDGDVEESEKRKEAQMKEKLPVSVKDGEQFASSNIQLKPRNKNPKSQERGAARGLGRGAPRPRGAARGRGRGGGTDQRSRAAQQARKAAANHSIRKRKETHPSRSRGRGRGGGVAKRAIMAPLAAAASEQDTRDDAPPASVECDQGPRDDANDAPVCDEFGGESGGDSAGEADDELCAAAPADGQSGAEACGEAHLAGGAAAAIALTHDPTGGMAQDRAGRPSNVDGGGADVSSRMDDIGGKHDRPGASGENESGVRAAAPADGESGAEAGGLQQARKMWVARPAGGVAIALAMADGAGMPPPMDVGGTEMTDAEILETLELLDACHDPGHEDQRPEFACDSDTKDADVPVATGTGHVDERQAAPDVASTEGLENASPEELEELTWNNHPFVISEHLTWQQVKAIGNPARCDYTRLLLQSFKWKPSVVTNPQIFEGSVVSCTLTRLDKLAFSVMENSGNRLFVLWEVSGLELIFITQLFRREGDLMARYFRVQSTKAALEEASGARDVNISQTISDGKTVYHNYLGKESLSALLNRESIGRRRLIGRTFHAGSVLQETKVENIVSFVGWVPERMKTDSMADIASALKLAVKKCENIDWVFYGDSFNELTLENEEENEEDKSSESDDENIKGRNTAGASNRSISIAGSHKKAKRPKK